MSKLNTLYQKMAACRRYGLTLAVLLIGSFAVLQAQNCTEKTLLFYDMDDCESFSSNGTNNDFSEFDPHFPDDGGCTDVSAPNLSNEYGAHSCVEGADGSTAGICVRGDSNYNFDNDDDSALRFSITVTPQQAGQLTELSFYQLSPTHYEHISGNSGTNQYLRRFGVRITKNGSQVFKQTGLVTNQHNWEFETFDLSNDPDFQITTTTTFDFEILGYRPSSQGSSSTRYFDVDEIRVKGCCQVDPCFADGGDADGDGVCANQDCDDNNPNLPTTPGTACNDGDANTVNDLIQGDGCSCAGTFDACATNGGDADGDGVCANQDCDDNNPNVPATAGTACNDGNANTENDVIQSDGCSCAGTPIVAGPDCDDIVITTEPGKIIVTGLDGTPVTSLQIFNSAWQPQFSCFANCGAMEMVNLPAGDYFVYAKYYDAAYNLICQINPTVTVTGGGCPDADNDGVCDADDCQPNNPAFPATPGSSCNDGNPNTTNDTVTADGCGCTGTPVSGCDNVNNGGQIGFGNSCQNSNNICGASGDVPNIVSCANPTGGSGQIEYLWLRNPVNCNPPTVTVAQILANPNISNWQIISGATSASYNPGTISTSTCYIRCARRAGCTDYLGESNVVSVTVDPNCGGGGDPDCADISITTGNGSIIVSGLDGAPISSLQIFTANWQQEFSCFDNCSATETVSGLANGDYFVYVKYYTAGYQLICQEVQTVTVGGGGCNDADNDGTCDADDCQPNNPAFPATPGSSCNDGNPNTTNDTVTADGCGCEGTPVSGCDNVNNGGQIGSDQTVCAGDAAATLTNVAPPTGGSGAIEYIWLSSTSSCPTSLTQTIAGATSATYNPGTLSTTTYFVRCSRRAGCSDWTVGESNCVTVTVDNSPNCGGGGGDPDCADISITTGTGSITVSGLDGAPISSLQIFNSAWQQEFSCFANCSATETVNVPAGSYQVYAKYYTSGYQLICQEAQTVTVTGGGCPDADNDGVCDADDCQPNNPAFPATPGTSCNDSNPNTTNDVITADGCGCQGTPVGCPDADNDGTCDADDCQPNNPAFPATPGTSCNDGNPNTTNDVVGNDGCSCAGTPVGGGPDCADISITTEPGKIIVSGLDGAPISSLQIFNSTWQQQFSCFADCSAMEMVNLPAGDYFVYAKYYTAGYTLICEVNPTVTVTGGGCPDADNDGVCDADDCQPNNPAFPATPGTSCNDGNPNTVNDVIGNDGCSCAGTVPDPCANQGGDNDNDGVCAAQDCDDNNPNVPTTPGTACNDGDANTSNDVIQADGCTCAGTAPVVVTENCGNNCFIYTGNVDYKAIGNSMNFSEAQDNCNKKSSSSASLSVPSGSSIVSATLHWSGSGSLDSSVKLNGQTVYADETFTDYTNPWYFFGAYADVTSQVQNNGNYTVSGLSWNNTSSYCQANAAYGAWSLVVVYANANNDNCRVHVCQDIFDFTYPEGNYNGTLHCVEATPGCTPNAELTFITFESDGYKGEHLYIGGQYFGDNNFNGQTAPNLDIATFSLGSAFNPNSSSITYSIQSYLTNTIWGPATEGLFDFVKVLKYDVCNSPVNSVTTANNDVNTFENVERMTPIKETTLAQDNELTEIAIDNNTMQATDIRLFPNPAGNYVNLDLSSVYGKNVEIYFYNNLGQQVKTAQVTDAADDLRIDLNQFENGLYQVMIKTENSKPVVKQLVISKF